MNEYLEVSLDYLDSAPHQLRFEQTLPVSAAALFRFFERTDTWGWAGIEKVIWTSEPPFDGNTTRTIELARGGRIEEQFLLWEQDRRMAFRLERGDPKPIGALLEDYSVTPVGEDQCRLVWRIAFEFRGLLRLLGPVLAPALDKQFGKMFEALPTALDAAGPA